MKKIWVTKPFAFAHEGIRVERIGEGVQEVEDECAKIALEEGWAEELRDALDEEEPEDEDLEEVADRDDETGSRADGAATPENDPPADPPPAAPLPAPHAPPKAPKAPKAPRGGKKKPAAE